MTHSSLFREYDIRGIVGDTLFEEDAYAIGAAFALTAKQHAEKPIICLGRDGRLSSPALYAALSQGLQSQGAQVLDCGLGPTPLLYFATTVEQATGGIMLTGSHNPPDHNGFKFMLAGKPFFGQQIQELREIIRKQELAFSSKESALSNSMPLPDVQERYLNTLLKAAPAKPLRVAWDAGNGATGEIMLKLCERLPGEHIPLFAEIDGTFPNHHPDPTVAENLEDLIHAVKRHSLDMGLAFDGDGDRLGVVDDEGEILWGDQLLALFAADMLKRHPGAVVIADVKASQMLFDEVAKAGGTPLMWKTGHSHIKAKMKETGALLAGEMSGHLFFADEYYGYDDGLYAAIRLLRLVAESGQKLSDLRKALPVWHSTPELRFPCDDTRKFQVIEEAQALLSAKHKGVSKVDGVRVSTPDGWWLLRASNTQAMLVARAEAKNESGLERLKAELKNLLNHCNVELPTDL